VSERKIAGIFAGAGGLLAIALSVLCPGEYSQMLVAGGLLLISNMMSFFVGETNGEKKATK